MNSNTEKKNFTGVQYYPDLDLHDGTKPMDAKYLFPDKCQLLVELWDIKNHGGTKGGIYYFHYKNFVIFQYFELNFESGLRTIRCNQVAYERLFLCLEFVPRKVFRLKST